MAEILAAQQSQFDARRASLEGELQILDKQIASKRSEINGLIGQQRSKESQLESFRAELAGLGDLMARGMVERTRVRNLEREIARLEGERAEHVSEVAAAGALIGERELQKFQARKSFHEGVVAELRQAQAEGFDYLERMGAARYVLEQTELKSPVDGTVVEMRAHTQGGVVGPGELLMEIVPSNDRLIIEAKVRPEDIDRVRLGLPAG
ncbi:MAG: HlyD family efflux transporter periplasmic adaptor subunit, partial [Thauera sp.]|nr:HlyD family efflux transporter periplasmic adaptor subunit [Thauera sp.]